MLSLAAPSNDVVEATILSLTTFGSVYLVAGVLIKVALAYQLYLLSTHLSGKGQDLALFPPVFWGLLAVSMIPSSMAFLGVLALFAGLHFTSWFQPGSPHWGRKSSGRKRGAAAHSRRVQELEAELEALRRQNRSDA